MIMIPALIQRAPFRRNNFHHPALMCFWLHLFECMRSMMMTQCRYYHIDCDLCVCRCFCVLMCAYEFAYSQVKIKKMKIFVFSYCVRVSVSVFQRGIKMNKNRGGFVKTNERSIRFSSKALEVVKKNKHSMIF